MRAVDRRKGVTIFSLKQSIAISPIKLLGKKPKTVAPQNLTESVLKLIFYLMKVQLKSVMPH